MLQVSFDTFNICCLGAQAQPSEPNVLRPESRAFRVSGAALGHFLAKFLPKMVIKKT
ncbi:hypothetical protein HanRHA438_Chr08g0351631 [Helianthus annuus]|nr:hypothetical protein HanRHA438_Chr08g0351631 [Helianthus annuus]